MSIAAKICSICRASKPSTLAFFHAVNGKLRSRCKECHREYIRSFYWKKPHVYRTARKRNYVKHPRIPLSESEKRARNKSRMDRWLANNANRKKKLDREYAASHRAEARKKASKWYRLNPEIAKTHRRNRRARTKGAEGSHTKEDISALRKLQNNKCAYCRSALGRDAHLDHIIPISKGGSNFRNNLQWLCPTCNLSKNDRMPLEYMRDLGLLL